VPSELDNHAHARQPDDSSDDEPTAPSPIATLRQALSCAEREHIVRALRIAGGRKAPTAQLLGVSRKCLWEKIRAHEILPAEYRDEVAHAQVVRAMGDMGVLLVEDNPADARIVCELLGESSAPRYNVQQVSRLGDIGGKLDDRRPDVILLDLHLPDSAGLATLEHVRALDSEIPIVVLTGAWEPGLERGALRGGADVMVSKDHVDAGLLARVLDYAVAQRKRLYGTGGVQTS
jgi:DNA-binding NtrC family response regulator